MSLGASCPQTPQGADGKRNLYFIESIYLTNKKLLMLHHDWMKLDIISFFETAVF